MKRDAVKVQDFLNNLKRQRDASGMESFVYFVQSKNGREYALKSYIMEKGRLIKFGTNSKFLSQLAWLKRETDELIEKGINIARIYDFGIVKSADGQERFLEIEEKLPGEPIYVLRQSSMENYKKIFTSQPKSVDEKQDEGFRRYINEKMQQYNLGQQEKILEAPDDSFYKMLSDFKKIYSKPGSVNLDIFPENFLFDSETNNFYMVDINGDRGLDILLRNERVICDFISTMNLSPERILNMGANKNLTSKIFKNNKYMEDRIIKTLENAELLVANSEKSKELLLASIGTRLSIQKRLQDKIKVLKK